MRLLFAIILLATIFPHSAFAAGINFSGKVQNQLWVRLPQNKMPDDTEGGDLLLLMTSFDLVARAASEDGAGRLFADLDFRADPVSNAFENDIEWRIREAYAGYYTQYVSFEVGKKIFTWGKTDEFNPTDLINPEDLRWFIAFDRPTRKLGVWSANLNFGYDKYALQVVGIPYFQPDILPKIGTTWVPWQLEEIYEIAGNFPDLVVLQQGNTPEPALKNGEAAARLMGNVAGVDLEAVYFNGFDPLPTFDINLSTDPAILLQGKGPLSIKDEYQRYQSYGGSLAFTAGKFAFRGEGAYYTPRWWMHDIDPALLAPDAKLDFATLIPEMLNTQWRFRKSSWAAAAGVDWRSGTTLYVNLQYAHTHINGWEKGMIDQAEEGIVSLKVMTKWLDEDLEIGADLAENPWHGDWYAKPYVGYKFSADFAAELGTQLYGGRPDTRFGDMKFNSFAYSSFSYTF